MRIAILGATGFVGRNLTRELASRGHQITGFVVRPPELQKSVIKYAPISDFNNSKILRGFDYEVVINLAARRSTRDNPLSDAEVRKFTFEIPKQFILHSAGPGTLVINSSTYIQNFEGTEGQTVDSYGAAKQELSQFLSETSAELRFNTLDLFFFTLYGEGDRSSHLVPLLLDAAKDEREISLSPGFQLMNLVHIDDAVRSIENCLTMERGFSFSKYHVWDEDYFSVRKLVSTIEETTGVSMNCLWGAREYAGHEMMKIWPLSTTMLPGFEVKIPLEVGIKKLWLQLLQR